MQAAGQLTQFRGGLQQLCSRVLDSIGHHHVAIDLRLLGQGAEPQTESDQALLRTVVEVTLDPPTGHVFGGDDTAGRGLDLLGLVLLHDDEPCLRDQGRQQAVL